MAEIQVCNHKINILKSEVVEENVVLHSSQVNAMHKILDHIATKFVSQQETST